MKKGGICPIEAWLPDKLLMYSQMDPSVQAFRRAILEGIPAELPPAKPLDPSVSHAPYRNIEGVLSRDEKILAIQNALRYFPAQHHPVLAVEFAEELERHGRIYMYRFRPDYAMYARPIEDYPHRSVS